MDPLLATLAFHPMPKVNWSLSAGVDQFISYNFATGTMRHYPAERLGLLERQKVDDGPVFPLFATMFEVNWLSDVTRKKISDVQRDHGRYAAVLADNGRFPSDVPSEVVDDVDDVFAREALWETGDGSSFCDDGLLLIATALQRLPKNVPTSRSQFADLIWSFVDYITSSRVTIKGAKREFERKK